MAKQMLQLYGFPYLTAPGEAEAECALLQREGVVDAVLSEDADTLMFGCTFSLRNWSNEGTRGNKSPTHVSAYSAQEIKDSKAGLDREGMILIALISGGDYIPAGIPGFGIKIACEAARAGFGKDLCSLSENDAVGLRQWKERLSYEINTNESGYFRMKRKSLRIPEAFPDKAVLGYYTRPVISSAEKVQDMIQSIQWDGTVNTQGLRDFVAQYFNWSKLLGAKKFIRGLAPALLVQELRKRSESVEVEIQDVATRVEQEGNLITSVLGRRTHFLTDGTPELRIQYIPADIVKLNLDQEERDDVAALSGSDPEMDLPGPESDSLSRSTGPAKGSSLSSYEPSQPENIWILESFVKLGVPLVVETWEDIMRDPKKFASQKSHRRDNTTKHGMRKGAIDQYLKVSKPGIATSHSIKSPSAINTVELIPELHVSRSLTPRQVDHELRETNTKGEESVTKKPRNILHTPTKANMSRGKTQRHPPALTDSPISSQVNPWTLARRPSDTFNVKLDSSKRYSALGIYGSQGINEGMPTSSPLSLENKHSSATSPTSLSFQRHVESPSVSSQYKLVEIDKTVSRIISGSSGKPVTIHLEQEAHQLLLREKSKLVKSSQDIKLPRNQQSISRSTTIGKQGTDENPRTKSALPSAMPERSCFPDTSLTAKHTSPLSSNTIASSSSSSTPYETTNRDSLKFRSFHQSRGLSERRRSRRLIALRESLEGTWKEMDHWELQVKNPKKTYTGVEVVDLT